MADWQEIVQTVIIGLVFAYMVTKLYALIASFRDEDLRVERGVTTSLLATSDTEELAPADEQNVPLSTPAEEELEADGEDEQEEDEARVSDSPSSDSEAEDDTQQPEGIHRTDESALPEVVSEGKDEDVVVKEEEPSKDVETDAAKGDLVDRFTSLGEHSLKALATEAGGDETKETDEGNETDDWEGVESTELEELFGAASTYVASMVTLPGVKPSGEAMLQLYAYYKIATEGPCSTSQPSAFQPSARAKWNAWQKLGNMPQEEAMHNYIGVLTLINPAWHKNYKQSKEPAKESVDKIEENSSHRSVKMGPGPVFSSLAMNEEGGEEGGTTLEPMHVCAREGDLEGLHRLLDHGSPIDVTDSDGRTPLIWAADRGHLSAVEMLVAKGADLHAKDLEGQTALHYATVCEREAIAKYLVEHGADANIADNDGATPLKLCPPHWVWLRSTST